MIENMIPMSDNLLRFTEVADLVAVGIIVYDQNSVARYMNPVARRIFGDNHTNIGHDLVDAAGQLLTPAEHPVARALAGDGPISGLQLGLRPNGALVSTWVKVDAALLPSEADLGGSAHVVVTLVDVSQEVFTASKLQRSEDSVHEIIEAIPVGICITDESGFFEFANRAYCDFYGYAETELIGRHFTMLIQQEFRQKVAKLYELFMQGTEARDMRREWQVVDKQGRSRVILTDGARIIGLDGKPRRVTSIVDISARRELELQLRKTTRGLEKLAITDVLTDLYNRRHADHLLQVEAKRADRSGGGLLIAMLDIDHFKRVNDEFGHACGDKVLVAVSAVIRRSLRDVDHACRYGGEEFLLILPATSLDLGLLALERLADNIRKLRVPPLDRALTISGGVTAFITGESIETTVRRADDALYQAKASGRDRIISG